MSQYPRNTQELTAAIVAARSDFAFQRFLEHAQRIAPRKDWKPATPPPKTE